MNKITGLEVNTAKNELRGKNILVTLFYKTASVTSLRLFGGHLRLRHLHLFSRVASTMIHDALWKTSPVQSIKVHVLPFTQEF